MATAHGASRSHDGIGSLPVWCQVAFAARCARRGRELFLRRKPDTSCERLALLDQALAVVEQAAADGRADLDATARAADDAAKIANGATDSTRAVAAATAVSVAADAARAAAFAPNHAPTSGPPAEYTVLARQAAQLAARAGADPAVLQEDLNLLVVGAKEFGLGYLDAAPPTLFAQPDDSDGPLIGHGPAGVVVRFDAEAAHPLDVGLVLEYLAAVYRTLGGPGLGVNGDAEWPPAPPPEPPAEPPAEGTTQPPPPGPWPPGGVTFALADVHSHHRSLLAAVPLLTERVNAILPDGAPTGARAWELNTCELPAAVAVPVGMRPVVERFVRYERERGRLLMAVRGPLPPGGAPGEETVVAASVTDDTVKDMPSGPKVIPERVSRLVEAADRHRRRMIEKLVVRRLELAAVFNTDGVLRVLVARRSPPKSSPR